MRTFSYFSVALLSTVALVSCSKEDNTPAESFLKTVAEVKVDEYTIRLQNASGSFVMGYNEVVLTAVKSSGEQVAIEEATFFPEMEMYKSDNNGGYTKEVNHRHSCPHTTLAKVGDQWKSQALFQMTTGATGSWYAKLTYKIAGVSKTIDRLDFVVKAQTNTALGKVGRFKVTSNTNPDGQMHLYAIVAPEKPIAGDNQLALGVWKMENKNSFPSATDFTIEVKITEKGNTAVLSTSELRYSDSFYRGNVTYPKKGSYVLTYTMKDAQGNVIQPKDNAGNAVILASEISF